MATVQEINFANGMARNRIVSEAIKQRIKVASGSMALVSGDLASNRIMLQPNPTGIQLGFFIQVKYNITNGTGGTITRTPNGGANLLQNVEYYDLANQPRTNTSGRTLNFLMSQKQGAPFGATITPDEAYGFGFGNWGVYDVPATIASGASDDLKFWFYLPLSYTEADLRGAVFGNVSQGLQRLNMTLANKSKLVVSSTSSPLEAVYQAAGATTTCTINSAEYTVYLNTYGMRLPMEQGQYVLPVNDMSTVYGITDTVVSGLTAGQQTQVAYPNAWTYLSTLATYENGTQLNAGTDVTDIEIKTASGISLGIYDPDFHAFTTALRLRAHPPAGTYYDSHQDNPIQVERYGAISYGFRPKTVNSGANLRISYEFFDRLASFSATGTNL